MAIVTDQEFELMIEEAYNAIPERFRTKVHNVAFLVEDSPPDSRGNILGIYHGIPRTGREHYGVGGVLPDTITIFRKPVEAASDGTHDSIQNIIRETVWHEVAHHFGMGEEMVREWERTMRNRLSRHPS